MVIPTYPLFINSHFTPSEAEQKPNMTIYNPYAFTMNAVSESSPHKSNKTVSSRVSKPIESGRITRKRTHKPTRIAEAAIKEIVYKQKTCKAEIHPNEDYGIFDPSRKLYEDPTLSTRTNAGKEQFWYFILTLLMDSTKKDVISWTGSGTEFKIISMPDLISHWSINQKLEKKLQKDTILRNFRACYKRRVMIPVSAQKYRFAFFTEPSIHIGMTHEELANFIAMNNLNDSSTEIQRNVHAEDSIYPTPPSSASEFINSFNPLSPSTEPFSDTAPAPMPHYPESINFFNPQFAQPLPIHFNNTDPAYKSYWIPPNPIMPEFVDLFQYQSVDNHEDTPDN